MLFYALLGVNHIYVRNMTPQMNLPQATASHLERMQSIISQSMIIYSIRYPIHNLAADHSFDYIIVWLSDGLV